MSISVTAGDVSTPVDEDGEEPAEARNPTFPQVLVLIFQQLKNLTGQLLYPWTITEIKGDISLLNVLTCLFLTS